MAFCSFGFIHSVFIYGDEVLASVGVARSAIANMTQDTNFRTIGVEPAIRTKATILLTAMLLTIPATSDTARRPSLVTAAPTLSRAGTFM